MKAQAGVLPDSETIPADRSGLRVLFVVPSFADFHRLLLSIAAGYSTSGLPAIIEAVGSDPIDFGAAHPLPRCSPSPAVAAAMRAATPHGPRRPQASPTIKVSVRAGRSLSLGANSPRNEAH